MASAKIEKEAAELNKAAKAGDMASVDLAQKSLTKAIQDDPAGQAQTDALSDAMNAAMNPEETRDSIVDFDRHVNFKIWKYNPDSVAGIIVRDTGVEIIGGTKTGIIVNDTTGITLKGPVAFTNMPNGVQFAGMWRMNNQLLSTIPSTIMTPVSVLDFYMPGKSMAMVFKKLGPQILASIGVAGAGAV